MFNKFPYVWDNWIIDMAKDDSMILGRFCLEAKRNGEPSSRHGSAQIGFYLPNKNGKYAKFCNLLEEIPSWSGSALNISHIGRTNDLNNLLDLGSSISDHNTFVFFDNDTINKFKDTAMLIPYTRNFPSKENISSPQAIALCYKKPGEISFKKHGTILNPYELKDENLKYYKIDDSKNVISAWRDPFILFENGRYHMFFAARYSEKFFNELPDSIKNKHCSTAQYSYNDDVNSTIGYAISDNLKDWKLMKPLILPGNASLFELPCLVKLDDGYAIMFVVINSKNPQLNKINHSTINNANKGPQIVGEKERYLSGFKTSSLDNIDGENVWHSFEQINKNTYPLEKTYGLTFKTIGNYVYATAFDRANLFATDIVKVKKDNFPFNFPSENASNWIVDDTKFENIQDI